MKKRRSREAFLNLDKVVHYPRYYKYDFKEKYKNIEKICFIGFNNKLPIDINKRSNYSKDVELITFDELGQRIVSFQTILRQKG
jgi:hypothetical protein